MSDVTLKNTSPLGDIQIPLLRIEVKAGATFTVPADVAEGLLEQTGNYELVNRKPEKKD